MTDIDRKAIEKLKSLDEKFFVDVIEPLETGLAHVFEMDDKGILVDINGVWAIVTEDHDTAVRYAKIIKEKRENGASIVVHNNVALDEISDIVHTSWRQVPCHVAALFSKELYKIETDATLKKLTHEYDELVWHTYNFFKDDPNGIVPAREAIDHGLFGAFVNGECVGFIGVHQEGTMGMLEILPQFRRHGYGIALEKYLANEFIKKGRYPFCHILETNTASIALQKEMGLWLSDKRVYWMG